MRTRINHITGKRTLLSLTIGNICLREHDAIVNAANTALERGGGVCGAIGSWGGQEIFDECAKKPILATGAGFYGGRCRVPVGQCASTSGGKLAAKYVIHTVGPRYDADKVQLTELRLINAYTNTLITASAMGLTSIAFPSLSTGIFGFPLDRAAELSMQVVTEFLANERHRLKHVEFTLFDAENYLAYRDALYAIRKDVTHRRKTGWLEVK